MTEERERYLTVLASEFDIDEDTVFMLADMLGESEDHDGLIDALKDFVGWEL